MQHKPIWGIAALLALQHPWLPPARSVPHGVQADDVPVEQRGNGHPHLQNFRVFRFFGQSCASWLGASSARCAARRGRGAGCLLLAGAQAMHT